jgi:hypothetical protein
MSFYWFMGSSEDDDSGGGDSGDVEMIVQGPFRVSTELQSSDGLLECFAGDEVNIRCQLVDAKGVALNCAGTTVTALITDTEGNTEVAPTVTAKWAEGGWYSVNFEPPATRGDYRLTLRRTDDDDVITAGPLIVRVDVR